MTRAWAIAGVLVCLLLPMWAFGGTVSHVKVIAQSTGSSGASMTFTLHPTNANDAITFFVGCNASGTPSAVSISASGWTFTNLTGIVGGSINWAAGFGAIAPNANSVTATVTWTVSGSSCGGFMNVLSDEFTGNDSTGGTTTFDAHNSGTTAGCGLSVTPANANDGVWFGCNDSSTGLGSGWSAGANDGSQDLAEYKVLTGGSGVSQTDSFTGGSGTTVVLGMTIKPSSSTVNNNASDSETLSNSDSITRGVGRSASESLSLSESIKRGVGRSPMTETLSLSDSIQRALVGSVTDTLSHSDSMAEMNARARSATETLSPSDSISHGTGKLIAETITLSESLQGNHATALVTENLGCSGCGGHLSESVSESTAHKPAFSETLSASDSVSEQEAYLRASSEALSVSDSLTKGAGKLASETLTTSDSASESTGHKQSLSESAAVSDSIGTSVPRSRSATDSVSVSDSSAIQTSHQRSIAEALSFSDSLQEKKAASRTVSETLSLSESISKGNLLENLPHSDVIGAHSGHQAAIVETASLNESIGVVVVRKKKKVVVVW